MTVTPYWTITVKVPGKKATKDVKATRGTTMPLCAFKAKYPGAGITHNCVFATFPEADPVLKQLKDAGMTGTLTPGRCEHDTCSIFPEQDDPEHAM